jgi:hypothetical protein
MTDQLSFQGIQVHGLEFLDELGLTPNIEIVKAGLPELWQGFACVPEGKPELLGGHFFPRPTAEPA